MHSCCVYPQSPLQADGSLLPHNCLELPAAVPTLAVLEVVSLSMRSILQTVLHVYFFREGHTTKTFDLSPLAGVLTSQKITS